jgi:hypothetical protein
LPIGFWVLPGNYYQISCSACVTTASGNGTFWTEWH